MDGRGGGEPPARGRHPSFMGSVLDSLECGDSSPLWVFPAEIQSGDESPHSKGGCPPFVRLGCVGAGRWRGRQPSPVCEPCWGLEFKGGGVAAGGASAPRPVCKSDGG